MGKLRKTLFEAVAPVLLMTALLACGCGAEPELGGGQKPEHITLGAALDLSDSGLSDTAALMGRTDLGSLDLTGNPIPCEAYNALAAALPGCDIRWSVPIGAGRFDSDTDSITLEEVPADLPDLLGYFTNLAEVHVLRCGDYAPLLTASRRYPDCRFFWTVSVGNDVWRQDTEVLDLSGREIDREELLGALAGLPAAKQVILNGAANLSDADKLTLIEAYPDVAFGWDVELLKGFVVNSNVTELDLEKRKVADVKAFGDKLALLPQIKTIDMCGCGPSNEEMEYLRERFPNIKFVWLIRVSEWIIRTDIKGFSTGNRKTFPDGAGEYVGGHNAYSFITTESLRNLKYCTDLIALDFGHCHKIHDISFIADLPKLRYLDFSLCNVDDISVLAQQTELEFLEMKTNNISDITPLRNCTKLKYLNCGINDISEIDTFLRLPQLERLWINCTLLTDDQVAALRTALPGTTITASPTKREYGESLWRKGNQGYIEMQKIYGLRAQHQGNLQP